MSVLALHRQWADQPQVPVTPDPQLIPPLSHLWIPSNLAVGMIDVAGGWHAPNMADGTQGLGQSGVAHIGSGAASLWGERGLYTASGFGNDWGTSTSSVVYSHTVFGLVEFDSLASSSEFAILRCDEQTTNYMFGLDVFPSTKTVRPLVRTSGTSGWTVNNDTVHNEIVVSTPLIIAYRYTDGSPIESLVAPIGGTQVWTKTATNVSGGIRQANTNAMYAHIGGFGNSGNASSFPGKIYMVGMVPYAIPDNVFQRIIDNPWCWALP